MKTYLSLFDDAVELEIGVDYDATYEPARGMGGPWEDSSPESSELILTGFNVVDVVEHDPDHPEITDEAISDAWIEARDRIEQECWDHFMESRHETHDC